MAFRIGVALASEDREAEESLGLRCTGVSRPLGGSLELGLAKSRPEAEAAEAPPSTTGL